MWNKRKFRMPDGAEIIGQQGDAFQVRVTVPVDEDGFLGRQCPACSLTFRVDAEGYGALPDDLILWCVYCGHHDEHSEFMTAQQRERIMRAAGDLGLQIVGQEVDKIFGGLSRSRSHNSLVSFSFKSKPFYPCPLPGISEERLARIRTCVECQVQYAVFGEHRYCPVCGQLPAGSIAFDALQADTARLDALDTVQAETKAVLRE